MGSVFKMKDLDNNCKMIEVDGYRFTLGYNFNGELQITTEKGITVKQPEVNKNAVFLTLGEKSI